jgi:hypothetical protein
MLVSSWPSSHANHAATARAARFKPLFMDEHRRQFLDDDLQALLVRCAVQAQLSHYSAFKNQLQSEWLTGFLDHEHLWGGVSQQGKTIRFNGVDGSGLKVGGSEYLRTMLRSEPWKFEVRYEVTGHLSSRSDAAVQGGMSEAAQSRRMNPYLQEKKYKMYTEVVEPRRVAASLMSICNQISAEWEADLLAIAREGAVLHALSSSEDARLASLVDLDAAPAGLGEEDATRDEPAAISEAFRACGMGMDEEAPSPFRIENFDLLQRTASYQAALSTRRHYGEGSAEAAWLAMRLEQWRPRWQEPRRLHLGNLFLMQSLQASPTPTQRVDGSLSMADPAVVATEVLAQRERLCLEWIEALPRLRQQRTALVAESLGEILADS